jgi:hypothetical protein
MLCFVMSATISAKNAMFGSSLPPVVTKKKAQRRKQKVLATRTTLKTLVNPGTHEGLSVSRLVKTCWTQLYAPAFLVWSVLLILFVFCVVLFFLFCLFLISHTGILMTFYLSIILDLHNFFHWYILQSWKLKDKYVIDEELQHTDHLFLGVACFTFMNFVWKICGIVA